MADAEGKLGKSGKEDHTELPGEIKNGLGGVSDVLASETGDEIKHTLGNHQLGRCCAGRAQLQNIVLGMGSGTGLKGRRAGRWRRGGRRALRIGHAQHRLGAW